MKIRRSIFDSVPEVNLHKHLSALWEDKVLILAHVPVKDVIDIYDKNSKISYSEREKFLVKSNFDFVVASKKEDEYGKPLLVIEFDGIGCGFSYNKAYNQVIKLDNDKYRKLKMDCKIRICEEAGLPLIVLSWDEIKSFFEDEELDIIDGIIGNVLCHDEFHRLMNEKNSEFEERIRRIDDIEVQHDILDSFVSACEVEAAINVNPIAKQCAKLNTKVVMENLVDKYGFRPIVEGDLIGYEWYAYLNDAKKTYLSQRVLVRMINCSKAKSSDVALDLAELLLWKKVIDISKHHKENL